MKIESYGISNVGMKRGQNEDNYLINEDLSLYIVADGMGGHLGGEFASRMAVTTIEEVIARIASPDSTDIHGVNTQGADYGERLRFAIQEASRRIHDQALYDESLKGMGTTTASALIHEGKAYIAHVGDSRVYFVRDGEIEQVTEDHSLVTEQVKAGLLSAEDAKGHRLKNVITRSVGYQEEVDVDLKVKELKVGDRMVLCSDGLTNLVDSKEINTFVNQYSLEESGQKLVALANERGGDDNITVVIIGVEE